MACSLSRGMYLISICKNLGLLDEEMSRKSILHFGFLNNKKKDGDEE